MFNEKKAMEIYQEALNKYQPEWDNMIALKLRAEKRVKEIQWEALRVVLNNAKEIFGGNDGK